MKGIVQHHAAGFNCRGLGYLMAGIKCQSATLFEATTLRPHEFDFEVFLKFTNLTADELLPRRPIFSDCSYSPEFRDITKAGKFLQCKLPQEEVSKHNLKVTRCDFIVIVIKKTAGIFEL